MPLPCSSGQFSQSEGCPQNGRSKSEQVLFFKSLEQLLLLWQTSLGKSNEYTGNSLPQEETKKEVVGNSYMPRKSEHYKKETHCGYPRETCDNFFAIKNVVLYIFISFCLSFSPIFNNVGNCLFSWKSRLRRR